MELFAGIAEELIAGSIGTVLGYSFKYSHDKYKKKWLQKNIREFFNISASSIVIVHSAIFDESRCAYNFPSCDSRSSRIISKLFESVKMTEGQDFSITYADQFVNNNQTVKKEIWENDLILLCSPKRNPVTGVVIESIPNARYKLFVDENTNETIIFDNERNERLVSSRDNNAYDNTDNHQGYDFGLILNMKNPHNILKSITILAGIHGAGTLGAAMFLSDPNNLSELNKRRNNGIIQEIVRAEYSGENENLTTIKLV